MAITKTSTTELSDIFNEVIKEGVVNLTTAVRNRPLLAILMKGKDNKSRVNANVKVGSFDKDTKTFKIKSRVSEVIGRYSAEGGAFPTGHPEYTNMTATAKYYLAGADASHLLMAIRDDIKPLKNGYAMELMKSIARGFNIHFDTSAHGRMLSGADADGAVTFTGSTTSSTTTHALTVDDNRDIGIGQEFNIDAAATLDGTAAASLPTFTCTAKSGTASATFTTTSNQSVANNDLIVRKGERSSDGKKYVTTLRAHINDTGTVQGVNKATNSWAQSYVESTNEALNEFTTTNNGGMFDAANEIYKEGGELQAILSSPVAYTAYMGDLVGDRQFVSSANKKRSIVEDYTGGVSGVAYTFAPSGTTVPVVLDNSQEDYSSTAGVMNFIGKDALTMARIDNGFLPGGIMGYFSQKVNSDGEMLDAFQVNYYDYHELGVINYKHLARLENKTA